MQDEVLPYEEFIQEIIKESKESETIEPGEHADRVLAELATSDAWKILKKFINDKRNRLEYMTRESIRKDKLDLQSTGFRYLIFDQLDAFAQEIIDRVENVAKFTKLSNEADTRKQ